MGINIDLTTELEHFAQSCVESGRFHDVSEVVRSALRMLQDAEKRKAAFVKSLDDAMEEGRQNGFLTVDEVVANVSAALDAAQRQS